MSAGSPSPEGMGPHPWVSVPESCADLSASLRREGCTSPKNRETTGMEMGLPGGPAPPTGRSSALRSESSRPGRKHVILPGLISAAFYRRRPSYLQIALGILFTVVLSGLLGYLQDVGTPRVWENVVLAIVGGLVLYFAILAYLLYRYLPRHPRTSPGASAPITGPAGPPETLKSTTQALPRSRRNPRDGRRGSTGTPTAA